MDNKKLNYFKSLLIEEKEKTLKSLENREERENEVMEFMDRELSSFDNHPGDIGTEVYMMEQEKGFKIKTEDTMEKIEDSLERINNGTYGICSQCNKEINEERLELIPYAKTCQECSKKGEDSLNPKEFTSGKSESPGFKMYISKENVGYDREDIYQDMLQDNIVPKDPSFSTGDNMGFAQEEDDDFV